MDYDSTEIPAAYDRTRDHGPEFLELWMNHLEPYVDRSQTGTILDLGCGTGRFADALAARFEATVIGVDPSQRMLERARQKQRGRVRYARGAGEAIPLPNASVSVIFISMAFHHFRDPRRVTRECRRILEENGPVLLRAGSRDRIPGYPYVPFFPSSRQLLEVRLPRTTSMRETFHAAGFHTDVVETVIQTVASSFSSYADKLAAGGDSILASLEKDDFEAGLSALRAHASSTDPRSVTEPIDFLVFR